MEKRTFALNKIDLKLERFLDFDHGFFIEAGAFDGKTQSNTLYFERYRKWKGLLIEPIPELAKLCRLNRPHAIIENCALVPTSYKDEFIEMRYCGLMSLVKGAMKSDEEELNHLEKGRMKQNNLEPRVIQVPARTLTSILEQHQISKIDLFSLDVEGYELNVLQGLDLERFRPTYFLIEARYRQEIDEYLRPLYRPIAELSHHDILYEAQ